eukprot:876320_1
MLDPLVANNSVVLTNNDILVYQTEYGNSCVCFSMPPITWNYTAPTPVLEQRGLTPTILRNEIRAINRLAAELSKDENLRRFGIISIIGCIVGIIGFIMMMTDFEQIYPGMAVMFVGSGIGMIGGFALRRKVSNLLQKIKN